MPIMAQDKTYYIHEFMILQTDPLGIVRNAEYDLVLEPYGATP